MTSPAAQVAEAFAQANEYAGNATEQLTAFTDALNGAIYASPTISVTWTPIEAPTALAVPAVPSTIADIAADLVWDAPVKPTALVEVAPTIVIDDFNEVAPVLDMPDAPTIVVGSAPVLDFGVRPTVGAVATVVIPAAPTIDAVATPTYLALNTPTFGGVDLHADILTDLQTDMPVLSLVAPTPYSYTPGPEYASGLLTALKAVLLTRIAGGTGLDPVVEQAIWDRMRTREAAAAQAEIDQLNDEHEAMGFPMPTGALTAALRESTRRYQDKISTANRDVAIKQAELEQTNMKDTINECVALEGKLIDYSYQLEKLAYDSAVEIAKNAIEVHNANLDRFKALLGEHELLVKVYDTVIKGEQLKVEVYRAELAGEQAKAEINRVLVEQFKAQIEAGLTQVKIYEAQVNGARAYIELEQAKLAATGEEIKAYIAGINGETARLEAYKVGVQVQGTKVDLYKAQIEGQTALVQTYAVKAQAFSAKAGAQAEKARAQVSYYQAIVQAKTAEWQGFSAEAQGESERFRALAAASGAALDGYKAETATVLTQVEQDIKRWEIGIKQYEAQQNYTLSGAKLNVEIIQGNRSTVLDAAKAGAQVYAQLTSSAYGMINAQASVSGSDQSTWSNSAQSSVSTQVSYSYGGNTPDVTAVTVMPIVPEAAL